ncbi:unnamed protein product, partial [Symbiodinium necroappetens]
VLTETDRLLVRNSVAALFAPEGASANEENSVVEEGSMFLEEWMKDYWTAEIQGLSTPEILELACGLREAGLGPGWPLNAILAETDRRLEPQGKLPPRHGLKLRQKGGTGVGRQDSGYLMNMLLGFIDNFSLPGPTFRSIEAMKMAGPVFNAKCRLFRLDPYLSSAPHLSESACTGAAPSFPALTGILVQVSLRFNLEPETMHEVEEVLRSLLSNPEAVKPLPTAYFVAVLSAICSFPIPKELPLRLVSSFLDREQMGQHTV